MKTYKFIVTGLVQGVCYRKSIYDNANNLNVTGEVKNLSNGDVLVYANLDSNNFDRFISILKNGSAYSKVSGVTSAKVDKRIFKSFSITY